MRVAVAGGTGVVGRQVVTALIAAGHEPIVLSRATGVDVERGIGVTQALHGSTAVVDVTSVQTLAAKRSEAFFGGVTHSMLSQSDVTLVLGH